MLKIDGSYGEGGGQILRMALFMSYLTNTPFEIYNIRVGRKKPGLKRQHLHIIKTLKKISECNVEGDYLGSTYISFEPGPLKSARLKVNFATAGSIPLYLQTMLYMAIIADKRISLSVTGGTDVPMAPSMDFIIKGFLPYIVGSGANVSIEVEKRGFYPKGGGHVIINIEPSDFDRDTCDAFIIKPFSRIERVEVFSVASVDLKDRKVAHRQMLYACKMIQKHLNVKVDGTFSYSKCNSTGSVVTVVAYGDSGQRILSCAFGALGKSSEAVGKEAVSRLLDELKKPVSVDSHLFDHLIPLLAIRSGYIKTSRITAHAKTVAWLVDRFLPGCLYLDEQNCEIRGGR